MKVLGRLGKEDSFALLVHDGRDDDSPVYWITAASDPENGGLRWRVTIREDRANPVVSAFFPEGVVYHLLEALVVMGDRKLPLPPGPFKDSPEELETPQASGRPQAQDFALLQDCVAPRVRLGWLGEYSVVREEGPFRVPVSSPEWREGNYLAAVRGDPGYSLSQSEHIFRERWEVILPPHVITEEIVRRIVQPG